MIVEASLSNASRPVQFSLRALLIAVVAISACLAIAAFFRNRSIRQQAELDRLAKLDKITVVEIVKAVEAVRTKLGRAPKNQIELESLLGKPMPVVHDNGYPRPISYQRKGEDSFYLQYELWATDDWIYDSDNPKAGWVQHWY